MTPTKVALLYVGPHDAVEVPDANLIAERDKPVDVDYDVAMQLLEQRDNWCKAPAKSDKGGN